VEYKKDQNWVTRSGDYLVFPGGGTQFKDGVGRYIQFIEQVNITISLFYVLRLEIQPNSTVIKY
jgi:hypothetical protein